MKRNKFIASILTVGFSPMLVFSQEQRNSLNEKNGFKIPSGKGRIHGHIKLKGVNSNIINVKISGSDNNGNLTIFEQT